jgi:hypothetical protein
MSTVVTTYLYRQHVKAVVNDFNNTGKIMSLFYAPNVKIYRGIAQDIHFQFKNRDNKSVSLTDSTATFILINKDEGTTYLERTLTWVDAPNGRAKLVLTDSDLYNLDAKFYTYSVKIVDGEGSTQVGYVDDKYGANGTLELVEGVYPIFVASTEEAFGSGNTGSTIYLRETQNRNNALHTAQVYFSSAFTGTLKIEASLSPTTQSINNDDFVTINTQSYTSQSDPVMVNWNGIYSAVRFVRTTTTGTLSKVLYRP